MDFSRRNSRRFLRGGEGDGADAITAAGSRDARPQQPRGCFWLLAPPSEPLGAKSHPQEALGAKSQTSEPLGAKSQPLEPLGAKSQPPPQPPSSLGCQSWTRGDPHMCLAFGRTKEKSPKCGRLGGAPGAESRKLRSGQKKNRKKKNNSLALTIPHKNVREIIKSICTAGGPRRRHHRQGTATKAQRDGLTPILGFGAVRGARVGPQKGSSGGRMDTGDC